MEDFNKQKDNESNDKIEAATGDFNQETINAGQLQNQSQQLNQTQQANQTHQLNQTQQVSQPQYNHMQEQPLPIYQSQQPGGQQIQYQNPQINQAQPVSQQIQYQDPQINQAPSGSQQGYYQQSQPGQQPGAYEGQPYQGQQYQTQNQGQSYQSQSYQGQPYQGQQFQRQQPQGQQTMYQQPQYQQANRQIGSQPYQYRQPQNRPVTQSDSNLAVASLILGIVAFLLDCIVFISIPAAIISLVLGIMSVKDNKGGKGMAIAGIVISSMALISLILMIIAFMIPGGDGTSIFDSFKNGFNDSY